MNAHIYWMSTAENKINMDDKRNIKRVQLWYGPASKNKICHFEYLNIHVKGISLHLMSKNIWSLLALCAEALSQPEPLSLIPHVIAVNVFLTEREHFPNYTSAGLAQHSQGTGSVSFNNWTGTEGWEVGWSFMNNQVSERSADGKSCPSSWLSWGEYV